MSPQRNGTPTGAGAPRRSRRRAVHGRPRRGDRERRAAVDQERPRTSAQSSLQWVITAYALMFGGFLLLGGRMADLLGGGGSSSPGSRSSPSARCSPGFAWSEASLIAVPRDQGLGGALLASGGAVDPDDDVRRRARAQHRARRLGRGLGKRSRCGRAPRRPAHELARLVLDLLHQRAGRHRASWR